MNVDFEKILFYATVIAGLIGLVDILFFAPRRKKDQKMPIISEYARSFFPVLLIVFLLRSFIYEPFRIPTGSLEPTLQIGDFILVNKFDYGLRLPIIHKKILSIGEPKRGDILVFRWPPNPAVDFIKRVIGLPGDHVSYIDKTLYVNGQKIPQTFLKDTEAQGEDNSVWDAKEYNENLLGVNHKIILNPLRASRDYEDIIVPPNMYFVMGDNRDDSADSRYWGFVPAENMVGKGSVIWLSWNNQTKRLRWDQMFRVIQ